MRLWRQPSRFAYRPQTCYTWNFAAGWSSSVARRAHNPEVVGSNPAPATRNTSLAVKETRSSKWTGFFFVQKISVKWSFLPLFRNETFGIEAHTRNRGSGHRDVRLSTLANPNLGLHSGHFRWFCSLFKHGFNIRDRLCEIGHRNPNRCCCNQGTAGQSSGGQAST